MLAKTACMVKKFLDVYGKQRSRRLQCSQRTSIPSSLEPTFDLLESFFKNGKAENMRNRILFAKQLNIHGLNKVVSFCTQFYVIYLLHWKIFF